MMTRDVQAAGTIIRYALVKQYKFIISTLNVQPLRAGRLLYCGENKRQAAGPGSIVSYGRYKKRMPKARAAKMIHLIFGMARPNT